MSLLADKLKTSFATDKEYRHGYVDEFLNAYVATQIKVLREQRNLTQQQLAELTNMKQERISVLENANYSSWSINTLRRLAEAFDLTLNVSFEDFGKRLRDIDRFSRESLERFSFDEDPVFKNSDSSDIAIEQPNASRALNDLFKRDNPVISIEDYRRKKDGILKQIPTGQRVHGDDSKDDANSMNLASAAGARR